MRRSPRGGGWGSEERFALHGIDDGGGAGGVIDDAFDAGGGGGGSRQGWLWWRLLGQYGWYDVVGILGVLVILGIICVWNDWFVGRSVIASVFSSLLLKYQFW